MSWDDGGSCPATARAFFIRHRCFFDRPPTPGSDNAAAIAEPTGLSVAGLVTLREGVTAGHQIEKCQGVSAPE
jgi:hypothetical protein